METLLREIPICKMMNQPNEAAVQLGYENMLRLAMERGLN